MPPRICLSGRSCRGAIDGSASGLRTECLEERSLAFAHRRIMTSAGFRVAKIQMRARNRSLYMAAACSPFVAYPIEEARGPAGASSPCIVPNLPVAIGTAA